MTQVEAIQTLAARINEAARIVESLQRRDKAQWARISELQKLVEAQGQQIMDLQAAVQILEYELELDDPNLDGVLVTRFPDANV